MQLLAIDQGNTRTKFGIFRDGLLEHTWVTATEKDAAPADLRAAIFHLPEPPDKLSIGLCTVVPGLLPAWQELSAELGWPLTILTGQSPTPLRNAYETPETLGPDRLMAAVGAVQQLGAPVISVLLGTATVVDAVDASRAYRGGMIAPGIGVAAEALARAASALRPVQWREPGRAIGASSDDAMVSGLFHFSIGGVRAMAQAARQEIGAEAPLLLTGWWADRVAPHVTGVALVDPHVVLRGVAATLA